MSRKMIDAIQMTAAVLVILTVLSLLVWVSTGKAHW